MAGKSLEEYTGEEIASMAQTYNALLENPETREVTLRATKKLNPGISIPEVDLKDQARGAFADVNKRLDGMQHEQLQREARERVERNRSSLKDQGYSPEDIAAIEKIMVDEQIPNYNTAAKYFKNARDLATPTPNSGEAQPGSTYELPQDALAASKGGNKQNLSKFARSAAESAMADLKAGRVKLH